MKMIRYANRQLMGIAVIVLLLIAIFAVLLTSQSNSSQKESTNQANDNNDITHTSTEFQSEDSTTLAVGTNLLASARFMEEYGVSEQYIKEIYIEDSVRDELDFDSINNLKVYHVAPCYTENELIEKLLALCSKEDGDVSISKQSYQALSENALIGWGNYYRYADTDGNVFLEGGARSVSYTDFENAIGIQVSEDEQADFLEDFVSEYHLGIWKDSENFLQPFAKSLIEGGEEEYLAETFIDGLKLRYVSANMQNLMGLAMLRKTIQREDVERTIERVGLDPNEKKPVRKYSLGMRQRLGIAQAIMEDPDVLVLDEPTNGLDNEGVEDIRKLLIGLKEAGKTILVASHNREDIEIMCDKVYTMDKGVLKENIS